MRFTIIIFVSVVLFAGCEKDITVDLPRPDEKFVIEGYMEKDAYPYLFISQNAAYFDELTLDDIVQLTVKDAEVWVSDGEQTEKLELIYDANQFPYYKYVGKVIKGQEGKNYSLKVIVGNDTLTSTTTIPYAVKIDSLKFKYEKELSTQLSDSLKLGYLWFYFTDPDTLGNYYKIFTKVLGEDSMYYQPFASVSDDKIINGQFVEFSTYRGRNPLVEFKEEEYYKWFFKTGDTIIFKFCSIDAKNYAFWSTLEMNYSSGGPFSAPITVKTNIEGGLGIWGGYGAEVDTLIAVIENN